MTKDEAKQLLINAGLVLDEAGLGDFTRGHVSIRVPGDPQHFYMKPHSYGLDEITMENLVTCNLEGEKVAGGGPRHSEVYIHSEIFKARPDVNSVIHAHPKHAVALSATGKPLRPFSQPSAVFCDGIGLYTDTIDLIRSKEMGAGVARALGNHKAAYLRNHGVAVVGRTVEECVILTIMLENAAEIQLLVDAAGGGATEFPLSDVQKLHDKIERPEQHQINFDYLVRRAKRIRGIK
jgi:ribulose-5-phosphate 4-epimerase/fuculose-1-phosphate aldolase